MNLLKIKNILKCTCTQNSNVSIYDDYLLCDICSKKYPIKENKVFFTDDFLNLNEWNHSEFKFDLFERIKKPNMPDVIGGPRLRDLVNTLGIDKKDDFLALNLGGGKDKFENVINIDIGNYENGKPNGYGKLIRINEDGNNYKKTFRIDFEKSQNLKGIQIKDGDTIFISKNSFSKASTFVKNVTDPFVNIWQIFALNNLLKN